MTETVFFKLFCLLTEYKFKKCRRSDIILYIRVLKVKIIIHLPYDYTARILESQLWSSSVTNIFPSDIERISEKTNEMMCVNVFYLKHVLSTYTILGSNRAMKKLLQI